MSDMISRQTAISAICNACGKIDCDKMDKCEKLQLPPANSSEFPNSSDCISRNAAIERIKLQMDRPDSVGQWAHNDKIAKVCYEIVIEALESLPSAEPMESHHRYEQGVIEGRVRMRTEMLKAIKDIVGDEVWNGI